MNHRIDSTHVCVVLFQYKSSKTLPLILSHIDRGVAQALDDPRVVPRQSGTETKQPCTGPLLQPSQSEVELGQGSLTYVYVYVLARSNRQ